MDKRFVILFIVLVINSCKSHTDTASAKEDSLSISRTDSTQAFADDHYYWEVSFEQKRGMRFVKTFPIAADSLNLSSIIDKLNFNYPEVKLQHLYLSSDTLFLKIADAKFLTQQMGSTGAQSYLGELTYNLTEIPGIHYIDLNFQEGDHANPGTFSRTDFSHFEK